MTIKKRLETVETVARKDAQTVGRMAPEEIRAINRGVDLAEKVEKTPEEIAELLEIEKATGIKFAEALAVLRSYV
jgi:hypothetical protein